MKKNSVWNVYRKPILIILSLGLTVTSHKVIFFFFFQSHKHHPIELAFLNWFIYMQSFLILLYFCVAEGLNGILQVLYLLR